MGDLGMGQPLDRAMWERYVLSRNGACEVCGGPGAETWIDKPMLRRKGLFVESKPKGNVILLYLCMKCGREHLERLQALARKGRWVTTSRGVQRAFPYGPEEVNFHTEGWWGWSIHASEGRPQPEV